MGKFNKVGSGKQSVKVQKNLHSVHKTINKNKKQKSISKNKNVASILANGKSKVKDAAGIFSDVVEEKNIKLGKELKKGKENVPAKLSLKENKKMKKKGKGNGHVASPQQASPPQQKAKKPLQKDIRSGGKHSKKQVQLDNGAGKHKRDLSDKNKIKKKKQKQTVRKNFVLLRQPSSSEDEDEDEDEDEEEAADNDASIKLEHLNETLASSTDSDDDEFDPKEESDAEMSDAHSGDSVVSDDIGDLSGDDSVEEPVLQDGGDESDSDEDDDEDEESDQVNQNGSLKVQHLNATLPSSDEEDEEYVPDEDEAKLKSPKKKNKKDESLNLTALENTINSSDEDDDDYVPDKSVADVEDDSSDAESDDEESEDESVTKKAPKRKAKEEEDDSDEESELETSVSVEGKADDTKEAKEYLASLKPFDEKAFKEIVSTENVSKIVAGLMKQVKEEMSKKKDKIFADYRYILQVTSFKIPKCPRRMAKLRLKHSLITEDDDVCFIVRDLERGRKVDYEETLHHYEDLFAEKGIKGIKAIMPFNQIRNEYKTYESKIKLSNLYDYYLCDGAIVGHVVGFLGKHFQKPRSTLYAVRMDSKDLAAEVEKAMHKTSFKQNNKGPTIAIPVGHCNMKNEQITENVMTIVEQLKDNYPGGLENIRNMNVKINLTGTSSLPIYVSFCRPPASVPNVVGPKEKHVKDVKKKTNEVLQKFSMIQTGELVKLDAEQVMKRKKEIKDATKAKKAKLEEGDKKSPTKTEDKSPSKDGKSKSDKENEVKDEANKSLNVSKKDKSLNVSKKEKSPKEKSVDVSRKESVSPKKGSSENEKNKKKKPQEVEDEEEDDDEESDEEDADEHEVEDDDSDEEEGEDEDDDDDDDDDDENEE